MLSRLRRRAEGVAPTRLLHLWRSEERLRRVEPPGERGARSTFWSMGVNQSVEGTDKGGGLINCSVNRSDRPAGRDFLLTGQANAMGGLGGWRSGPRACLATAM